MVNISFPGIGIDTFTVNRVAFTIPIGSGIEVRWYGIIITLGMILAVLYCYYRSKSEGISLDDLLDMALFSIIAGIVGARVYYVLMSLDEYDSFLDMIAIWNGGLAIYGGIIGGALAIFFVCRHKKIKVMKAYDMAAPAVMIGQILGRWGNFFNGEAHGTELVEGDFMYFMRMGLSYGTSTKMTYYHPTFLYESVWNLIGFIIINALYKKKKFDGQVFLMYITWYGFGRMFIEGLRTDSLYLGVFRVSQVVAFLCFVIGSVLLIYNLVKSHREMLTNLEYTPAYPKFSSQSLYGESEGSDTLGENVSDVDGEAASGAYVDNYGVSESVTGDPDENGTEALTDTDGADNAESTETDAKVDSEAKDGKDNRDN
ncbi:MAG: prolipoprotein diacylglyceryl transferase [Eubacteriales bacterium]